MFLQKEEKTFWPDIFSFPLEMEPLIIKFFFKSGLAKPLVEVVNTQKCEVKVTISL